MVEKNGRVLRLKRYADIMLELGYLKQKYANKRDKQPALYVINPCHFITFKIDKHNNLVANLLLHHENCVRLKNGVTKTKIPLTDGSDLCYAIQPKSVTGDSVKESVRAMVEELAENVKQAG